MLDLLFTGTPPPSPSDLPEDRRIWIDYARMLEFISYMLELAQQPPSQPGAG